MKKQNIAYLLSLLTVFSACSGSKKAFKKAREYEAAGLYVEAAEADLRALQKDRNYKDAKVHLRKVAPQAYEELLGRGTKLEQARNWDEAVAAYQQLDGFLGRIGLHGIVLATIDVRAKLDETSKLAAREHFERAEALFAKKRWTKAANAYLRAHELVENFGRSFDKAIQSLVNSGNGWLKKKEYQRALQPFNRVLEIAPNHPVGKKKVAEAHFLLGRQHFDDKQYRKSLQEFEEVEKIKPGYKNLVEWLDRAYQHAVQQVAVFPFLNRTRIEADGYLAASAVHDQLVRKNLPFADFMPLPETLVILERAGHSRYGLLNESQLINLARREKLDSIVWGTVLDIDVNDWAEDPIEVEMVRVETDSTGEEIEVGTGVFFREHTHKRRVRVTLEHLIIETHEGRVQDRERYSEDITDVARWIAYQGSIYDLPEEKRPLLDAPRDPRAVPVLVNEMLIASAERIGRKVAKFYR